MTDNTLRLDKWLWFARFYKSRSLAAQAILDQTVQVNGVTVQKTSHTLRRGDVVTLTLGRWQKHLQIVALADHRGPAPFAQTLYTLLQDGPVDPNQP